MKVVHYSKTVGYGGTDKVAQMMCKYLAQDDDFEPFLLYSTRGDQARLNEVREFLDEEHLIEYNIKHEKRPHAPYRPVETNLPEILADLDPDIIHVHRSGYPEWPVLPGVLTARAKIVETNIFGYADTQGVVDKHVYISDFIRRSALNAGNPDGPVLYNPTEPPAVAPEILGGDLYMTKKFGHDMLCEQLRISPNSILLGRVGRPDNFDPIALRAFNALVADNPNIHYVVVGACDNWRRWVAENETPNVHFMPHPLVSDKELSEFLMSLDIYCHARSDGECCPCNIQEAMMHGLPVISHLTNALNGQEEILAGAGFVVPHKDAETYMYILKTLVDYPDLRKIFGDRARVKAEREFAAEKIVGDLKDIYHEVCAC